MAPKCTKKVSLFCVKIHEKLKMQIFVFSKNCEFLHRKVILFWCIFKKMAEMKKFMVEKKVKKCHFLKMHQKSITFLCKNSRKFENANFCIFKKM
jgi:hypothetical protein